jgi:hypothetical protein
MGKRNIVRPFKVGNKRINSINDLKEILSKKPYLLINALKDGRLKRFLESINSSYLSCLDKNDPIKSLKKLGELLGVKVPDINEGSNILIESPEELNELIKSGFKQIEFPSGNFLIKELILDKPVKIKGQDRTKTKLIIDYLKINSEDVIFENLWVEPKKYIALKKPRIKNAIIRKDNNKPRKINTNTYTTPSKGSLWQAIIYFFKTPIYILNFLLESFFLILGIFLIILEILSLPFKILKKFRK